jgi:hypothetical protein
VKTISKSYELSEALSRTLLLMKDELSEDISDDALLGALTETRIALVADAKNLKSHSAQTAYATAAILLARSGHQVTLAAPNIEMVGAQPPLAAGGLIDQLVVTAPNLLPDTSFTVGDIRNCDLAVCFGDAELSTGASRLIHVNATSWQAQMYSVADKHPWAAADWPIGAMGTAALAAAEAFKIAMRRLRFAATNQVIFDQLFSLSDEVTVDFAPPNTREMSQLYQADFVSGGAINSAALYALLRLPYLRGAARIIEYDTVALSNLNRGMLFLLSDLNSLKAEKLSAYERQEFSIFPLPIKFDNEWYAKLGKISDAVLVGVDDIPARWHVQKSWPRWLGVGATTHFNSMASFHTRETPCAGCLHPKDDQTERAIPTVAFVSFWAGLWLASYYLRHLASDDCVKEQQAYFCPLRPEFVWRAPVARRVDCPVQCSQRAGTNRVVERT